METLKKDWITQLGIFLFAILLYSNTFNHEFALDDDIAIGKNEFVQEGLFGIKDIFSYSYIYGYTKQNDQSYRPLPLLTFAIEKEYFGNNSSAMHITNAILYGLCCILFLLFLRNSFPQFSTPFTILIVLFFASHPIHTEAVANIKSRDEILQGIFVLLTLIYSLKYADTKQNRFLVIAAVWFFLGLLSKEMTLTFLAIIPITLYFFKKVTFRKLRKPFFVFLGTALIYFFIRSNILNSLTFEIPIDALNSTVAGAESRGSKIATASYILLHYIKLLFIPHPLSWDYSTAHFPILEFTSPKAIFAYIIILGHLGFAIYRLKLQRIYAYTILFFFLSLSVVSNYYVEIGSTLGERFLFLPSIAFCIAIPMLINEITTHKKKLTYSILGIIIVMFSLKTIERNAEWKNNETIYSAGAIAVPNSTRTQAGLATVFRTKAENHPDKKTKKELYSKAAKLYKRSVELYPPNFESWYNYGVCLYALGKPSEAVNAYENTLKYDSLNYNALNNLGFIYFGAHKYKKAEKYFVKMVKYFPANPLGYGNLGAVYQNTGKHELALKNYKKCIRLNPNDQITLKNLIRLLKQMGKIEESEKYKKMIRT